MHISDDSMRDARVPWKILGRAVNRQTGQVRAVPLLLLPHDMDCESGKPSNHTRWYRGSGACHYSDEEKWWWHWGDAIQASAPKDQNYAGRQGVHTLVVMSETPSIQRHSLSMSPKGLCNFFRLCVVSSCVFSVVAAWSHAWTNYMEPFELRHPGG